MVWEDRCRVTSRREDFGFSEQDGGDMEPCPCNRQEQEVLPVLSQLCAQSMLNDLSPWSRGGDGVLQILLLRSPPIHWVRVGCLSLTLKVSHFLDMESCQWSLVPIDGSRASHYGTTFPVTHCRRRGGMNEGQTAWCPCICGTIETLM